MAGQGLISMQDRGIMSLYVNNSSSSWTSVSSSSLSSSMQSMGPLTHHHHDIMYPLSNIVNHGTPVNMPTCATGYLDSYMGMAPPHEAVNVDGFVSGTNNGMLGDHNFSGLLQGELSVPSLESISIEDNGQISEDVLFDRSISNNNDHFEHNHHIVVDRVNNTTSVNNCINTSKKVETVVAAGTKWEVGGDLRMTEWDFEDLMRDVSSFPFVDYQLE